MNDKDFIELFVKDCEYYDNEEKELNALLSLVNFEKNEKLIDVGAGIGRLAIPLSKFLEVTAIDTNKALLDQIKDSNIEIINLKIEDYFPKQKFDYALIVWPGFHNYVEVFKHIKKKILKENGKLLIIKSLGHDLKRVTKKIFPEIFGQQKGFLKVLNEFFEKKEEKIIETEWIYPNFDEALKLIIFELEAFYGKKIVDNQIEIVKEFIREHEKSGKIYMNARLQISVNLPK